MLVLALLFVVAGMSSTALLPPLSFPRLMTLSVTETCSSSSSIMAKFDDDEESVLLLIVS